MRLTESQLQQLRSKNYVLVEHFWDQPTCDAVVDILRGRCTKDHPWELFPHAPEDALLWQVVVGNDLVDIAERYLETPDIALGGSHFQRRVYGDGLDNE